MRFPKILLVIASLMLMAFLPTVGLAQTSDAPAFAQMDSSQPVATEAFREEVAKGIVQEARKSDQLTRREKRKVERVMRGGWFNQWRRDAMIDHVVRKMHDEGQIEVTPDGVQAAVDWSEIISLVKKYLPVLLELLSLFGG